MAPISHELEPPVKPGRFNFTGLGTVYGAVVMVAVCLFLGLMDAIIGTRMLNDVFHHPRAIQALVLVGGGINATAYLIEENWTPGAAAVTLLVFSFRFLIGHRCSARLKTI